MKSGWPPKRKTLLTKCHTTVRFVFEHRKKPNDLWLCIRRSNETKANLFQSDVVQHVWHGPGQDYHSDSIECLLCTCLSAKDAGKMTFIDGSKNVFVYPNTE